MTATNIVSGQSIGTSTNIGEGKFPQKVTAQSSTDRFFVEVKITNGADSYNPKQAVVAWYAASNYSITAASAVIQLKKTARRMDCTPSRIGSEAISWRSECEPLSGAYIYVWFDVPNLPTAASLDAYVTEGP